MFKKFLMAALVAVVSYSFYCGYNNSKMYWSTAVENLKSTAQTSRN